MDCARWLAACLKLGWHKDKLDALEALWWRGHDPRGHIIAEDEQWCEFCRSRGLDALEGQK